MPSQMRRGWLVLALHGRVSLKAIAVDIRGCLADPKSSLHSHVLPMKLHSRYFAPSPVSDSEKHDLLSGKRCQRDAVEEMKVKD